MIMRRTTLLLPEELRIRAAKLAERAGISLGELIRQSLRKAVSRGGRKREEDPLFSDDYVYKGPAPKDSSVRHDDTLYGDEP